MANDKDRRPVRPLTERLAPVIAQYMRNNRITQTALGRELDRDQSYVSERVTGKRAFTTDELDGIAKLAGETPRSFIAHLANSLGNTEKPGNVVEGRFGVGTADNDELRAAAKSKGRDRGGDDGQG